MPDQSSLSEASLATTQVIVLNGTSSAGKWMLASALQARLAEAGECWIVLGLDDFLGKLPWAWVTYGDHVVNTPTRASRSRWSKVRWSAALAESVSGCSPPIAVLSLRSHGPAST